LNSTRQRTKKYLTFKEIDERSDFRGFRPFPLSSRIYFNVRNDTATFSARISHRRIARRRDTARLSDETFRTSLLRCTFSTSRPFLLSFFWLLVIFLARFEDSAWSFVDSSPTSADFARSLSVPPASSYPSSLGGDERICGRTLENVSRKSTIYPPLPRLIDTILLVRRDLSAPPLYTWLIRADFADLLPLRIHVCSPTVLTPSKNQNVRNIYRKMYCIK